MAKRQSPPAAVAAGRLGLLGQHVVAAAGAAPASPPPPSSSRQHLWDLVLCGGRVIDPESGTDAVLNVAVCGDKVVAVGLPSQVDPACAAASEDCRGLVVCPGFIDLHSHGQTNHNAMLQAFDGVTTQLELELGTWPVDSFLAEREAEGAVLNFGSSVGHIPTRVAALTGAAVPFSITDPCCMLETKQTDQPAHRQRADDASRSRLVDMLGEGLEQGGIGIGAGFVYTPGADHKETYELIRTVGKHGVALFVHIRQLHPLHSAGMVGMEDFHEVRGPSHTHVFEQQAAGLPRLTGRAPCMLRSWRTLRPTAPPCTSVTHLRPAVTLAHQDLGTCSKWLALQPVRRLA